MKFTDIERALKADPEGDGYSKVTEKALTDILDALSQVYPMILLANLTQNKYVMLRDKGFLYEPTCACGIYDEMIDSGRKNVHPNYQSAFLDAFDRKVLMARYENGVHQVSANLYQKGENGEYQWVVTKVIRLEDESGDIVQLCLNEVLPQ